MELIKRARRMQLTWMQLIADFTLGHKSKYAVAGEAAQQESTLVAGGREIEYIYTYPSQHLN
jgi:hypothetical protein